MLLVKCFVCFGRVVLMGFSAVYKGVAYKIFINL